jgi:hypothetical protein
LALPEEHEILSGTGGSKMADETAAMLSVEIGDDMEPDNPLAD